LLPSTKKLFELQTILACCRRVDWLLFTHCRCIFFAENREILQEIMIQSLVFEISSHGEVRFLLLSLFYVLLPFLPFSPHVARANSRLFHGSFCRPAAKETRHVLSRMPQASVLPRALPMIFSGHFLPRTQLPQSWAPMSAFSLRALVLIMTVTRPFSCGIAL
jgi:hypothetical protein